MKRNFSCLMVLLTMLLFGASGSIEAMEALSDAAAVATESAEKAFIKSTGAMADDTIVNLSADEAKTLADGIKGVQADAQKLGLAVDDSKALIQASVEKSMTLGEDGAAEISSFTKDYGSLTADKVSVSALGKMTTAEGDDFIESLLKSGMNKDANAALKESFDASKSILPDAIAKQVQSASSFFEKITGKTAAKDANAADRATLESKDATEAQKARATKNINEREYEEATTAGKAIRYLSSGASALKGPLEMGLGTIGMAVLFMVPSIFQSSFLAQEAQNALLQTYAPPIAFGNIVLQLPDSVINMSSPAMSNFVYYGIPVSSPGASLSKAAAAQYKDLSNPTASNKVSAGISNAYAQAFSLGATKKLSIPRYNLGANALSTLPIFVSYSSQSWQSWASNGVPDAAFPGTMVNLNTGAIFYADGTSEGTPPATLIGAAGQSGATVQSFMSTYLAKLESAGATATYTQYQNIMSSSKAGAVASPLANQFDCACLEANNGVLSSATVSTCSGTKASTCLLTQALNQLSAGLVINSAGTVMTPDQDLAAEVAKGALGQVIPIQGLGSNFDTILQMFPGAEQNAIANSGVLTVSLGTNMSTATTTAIQGAAPDNYAAKGIYVYQCKNTPLAKVLSSQAGGSAAMNSQITDYIVFLDTNLNQVPMMVPVQNPANYNFYSMGLNPAIQYVSTIIGNTDSSGNFTFLPQLNIQSPAALVAKGLPASFAPLYGLQAANGSLAVNYNQNLASAIGTIAQSLSSNPKLGQQFKTMQTAMLNLLGNGPYGQYNLNPISAAMQPNIGGVNLVMYTGFNSYPASQDSSSANCSDVLIPISSAGKTVTLPSNNVAQYYGLVTDITYTVASDGSIFVSPAGLKNSPFNAQTWSINQSQASTFYWMNKLTQMGGSGFTMPQQLVTFVQQARTAWINWIKSTKASSEYIGITLPGASSVLTIASQQALQNGLYVYTCSPAPSGTQDYFVLTNSSSPQATDATLGTMSATKATAQTNMISLVSGQVYNAVTGAPVQNGAGVAYTVTVQTLLQALSAANPKAFSSNLSTELNIAVSQTAASGSAIDYPFNFGGLQLGLYKADEAINVYLYINAAGAGSSASFQPSDYLVTVDSYTSPQTAGTKLASSTQYMISLVSGTVYGPTGAVDSMDPQILAAIIGSLSPSWRPGVAAQITALTASLATTSQNQQQQTSTMNAAPVAYSNGITMTQAAVAQIIANISNLNFLPAPYDMLKQDPSGVYVLISPASADGTQFMYTLFDVPNSITDANGKPMHVGAQFDGNGDLLCLISGIQLISLLQQYGVGIDATGKQYLGANNLLPLMQLDPADVALRPGVSGKSMIYSNDPKFPSHGITSPIAAQDGSNNQFYIYYNLICNAYYAMQVNGSNISYIDMAGGSVYNADGSPQVATNPVAANASGDKTDLFLPYLNPDSFTRCFMKNVQNNNMYSDFLNSEPDFQPTNDPATNNPCGLNLLYALDASVAAVNVAQMPFPDPSTMTAMPDLTIANQYNVYWNQSSSTAITYNIDPTLQSQSLMLLPINMTTRAVLNPMPAAVYNSARLILKNNVPYAAVFGGQFYSNAQQKSASSYTMTSSTGSTITGSVLVDSKTNAKYVAIVSGGTTYNYQLSFMTLPTSVLQNYQNNVWQMQMIADVTGKVTLEPYLSIDGSGNLQLSPVSMQSVINVPTNAAAKSALSTSLGNIMQDATTNRFLVAVNATTYPYFTQAGYVNLEDGALFNSTGMTVGYTLYVTDLIAMLQQLNVAVMRNSTTNVAALSYRASAPSASAGASASTASAAASAPTPSYVPAASAAQAPVQTYQPASTAQSAPAATYQPAASSSAGASQASGSQAAAASSYNSYQAPAATYQPAASNSAGASQASGSQAAAASSYNSYQAPAQSYSAPALTQVLQAAPMASVAASSANSNQIAALQYQETALTNDIASRQAQLKTQTVPQTQQMLRNAILTDQQQIAADQQQIAALSAASAGSRSTLLGRLSSKMSKKKSHSGKQAKHAA